MKRFLQAAALAFAMVSAAAQIAFAEPAAGSAAAFQATTLSLTADGEVMVAPDTASIMLGVRNEAPTAAQALAANAQQMTRVVASLRRAGLPDKDIRTSALSVSPKYAYEPNQPPRLTGYEASNQVTITTHDLKRLGPTIDAAVGAGATDVNSISFGLSDPTAAQDSARLAAVRALQAKADLYAKALGHPILRLVSLSEESASIPPPPVPRFQAARAAAETPVSPGELQVRVELTGVYELAR